MPVSHLSRTSKDSTTFDNVKAGSAASAVPTDQPPGESGNEERNGQPLHPVSEAEALQQHPTLKLEALVRMKLTSFRDQDRMHLRDMIDVELVDATWCSRFPPVLAARLKELLDNPHG